MPQSGLHLVAVSLGGYLFFDGFVLQELLSAFRALYLRDTFHSVVVDHLLHLHGLLLLRLLLHLPRLLLLRRLLLLWKVHHHLLLLLHPFLNLHKGFDTVPLFSRTSNSRPNNRHCRCHSLEPPNFRFVTAAGKRVVEPCTVAPRTLRDGVAGRGVRENPARHGRFVWHHVASHRGSVVML